jgi:hypothetical protein
VSAPCGQITGFVFLPLAPIFRLPIAEQRAYMVVGCWLYFVNMCLAIRIYNLPGIGLRGFYPSSSLVEQPLYSGRRRFDSARGCHYSTLAQSVAQRIVTPKVSGSSPECRAKPAGMLSATPRWFSNQVFPVGRIFYFGVIELCFFDTPCLISKWSQFR